MTEPRRAFSVDLPALKVSSLSGKEHFSFIGAPIKSTVKDFWSWSASDLVSNATRGRLAEFIVAMALDVDLNGVRDEWQAFDLVTRTGVKIEVKSAAYVQSWSQEDYSAISFATPKTKSWDREHNIQAQETMRQADIYVFSLLAHKDKATINPLDLSQWEFYVLATKQLNERTRSQHSITLKSLQALAGAAVRYSELASHVSEVTNPSRNTVRTLD